MSKNVLEETDKKHAFLSNQEDENDEYYAENTDIESERNKIVEYSPKGRFIRFNEELGSGAYKTVYKAYDNETGWEVAWNVIKLQRLPDKERKRISDEIALLKQLKHSNIIHFISAWINRQKEEVIFITEAVTGGSLKRYLRKIRRPRLKVIKTWCKEILQGIDYLHSLEPHPIIHRDIKCDNIFINSNKGEIRIGDLGLATFMSNAFAASVLGTPEFMAPEMYEEVYGPSVDIYSFGMCVLEMVTNRTPYEECMNPAQIYKKVCKGIKPNALNLVGNEDVKNFIIECLQNKDERPTASQLLKHEFLTASDGELDNQPVQLHEGLPLSKIEEINSTAVSTIRKEIKSSGSSAIVESSGNHRDTREKSQTERNSAEKLQSSPENTLKEDRSESLSRSPQQPFEESKQEEINQPIDKQVITNVEQPAIVQERQQIINEENKERLEQVSNNQEKIMRSRKSIKEERKSSDHETHSGGGDSARIGNKESDKYHFSLKGMNSKFLAISVKKEKRGSFDEQVVKIEKGKISAEKIKRKLFKHIDCPNPSDLGFLQKLNTLFETLVLQGILPPPHNLTHNSTAPTHSRLHSNDFHTSPFKSGAPHTMTSVFFQSKYFTKFYKKYLKKIPKEYLMMESEEAMNLRHQREMLELENIHLMQKRNMWDHKQSVMSNSFASGIHLNPFDTDDYHHQKFFQINDINYQSEINKKEPRFTECTMSSVDSAATLSPTCSTGSHVQSFPNWNEMNLANMRKEDALHGNITEEAAKLSLQSHETSCDTDRSSSLNADLTPMGQLNLQLNLGSVNNAGSQRGSVLSAKHVASSFALHAMKANTTKAQSDKSAQKERRYPEFPLKEGTSLSKRSSIERNLENAQNLAQSVLQQDASQYQVHVTAPTAIQNTNNGQSTQSQPEAEKIAKEKGLEIKNDTKHDQLVINTNLLSPSEKSTTISQVSHDSATLPKPQQQAPIISEKAPDSTLGKDNSTPTNLNKKEEEQNYHNNPSTVVQNASLSQPNSATSNKTTTTISNPSSTSNLTNCTTPVQNPPASTNPNAQKLTLTSQSSAGCLLNKPGAPASGFQSSRHLKNSLSMQMNHQSSGENLSKSAVKFDEFSHPTHVKLQPVELFDKIKNYKLAGTLRLQEIGMSHEDVKMLQICLELLTESDILASGNFSNYTENLVKTCQKSIGIPVTGVVDHGVWEKMIDALDKKMEKRRLTKGVTKQNDVAELDKDREEIKRKMKDKQNKEASECMNKIQSNLIDLSDLK